MSIEEILQLVTAGIGGGLLTEVVRRVIPSQDKSMELQVQKETEVAKTQIDLTKTLWDEILRLSTRVQALDKKLVEAQETIIALNSANRLLQTDMEILNKRMGCLNYKPVEEPHIILSTDIKEST